MTRKRRHSSSRKDSSCHSRTVQSSCHSDRKDSSCHSDRKDRSYRSDRKDRSYRSDHKDRPCHSDRKDRSSHSHNNQLEDNDQKFGKYLRGDYDEKKPKIEKEKPNFEPSGKLAEDTNTYRGVVIKYNEPPDAHMPKLRWRLYPFKGDESLPVLYIHRQSAYLIGRDRKIADLPVDHPSCSKQHAVFQYRLRSVDLSDGTTVKRVCPYIIDLGSANGTYLNNERIEAQRYVELREKDVLKFGFSTREFVLLNEKSYNAEDGDLKVEIKKEDSSPS